jgi:hypothetical protein
MPSLSIIFIIEILVLKGVDPYNYTVLRIKGKGLKRRDERMGIYFGIKTCNISMIS